MILDWSESKVCGLYEISCPGWVHHKPFLPHRPGECLSHLKSRDDFRVFLEIVCQLILTTNIAVLLNWEQIKMQLVLKKQINTLILNDQNKALQ